MTRILVATDDGALEQRIREAFGATLNGDLRLWPLADLGGEPAQAAEQLLAEPARPEVLVLGADLPTRRALALAEYVDRERPDVSVLLMAERDPAVLERAMQAGVRAVVPPGADGPALRQSVEQALDVTARRRSQLASLPLPPVPPPGRTIVVASPKGGSGKTTVCANLAVGLAREGHGGTVLVDLDLQFGDVGSALRLLPESTWADVARARDIDAMSLKAYLTKHPSGLFALCSPEKPADGELIKPGLVTRVLELLGHEFRNVVVDTSAGLDEYTLAALEASTDVVLLCSMDVPSVRSLCKEIALLDQLGMTGKRRHFVLNRADSRVGLEREDVESTVGLPVHVALPSARSVPLSLNQGIPVVESEPRSAVGKQLSALVSRFAPPQAQRSRGLLRRKKD